MPTAVEELEGIIHGEYDHPMEFVARLRVWASRSAPNREQLRQFVEAHSNPEAQLAFRLGAACLILGQYERAVQSLKAAPEGTEKRYLLGCSYQTLGDYKAAITEFERAMNRGWDAVDGLAQVAQCYRLAGQLDQAAKTLDSLGKTGQDRCEYYYQRAELLEAEGRTLEAIQHLQRAIQIDENYQPALFRLAYLMDLRGNDEEAIDLYNRCISQESPHVNAMLNLAILYEDTQQFDKAIDLLQRVLAVYPNHERARLFLKDVRSSQDMYYDEEAEKRRDKHNQVLEIPISDFELSVRSRNCLKKMGIRTLGDLTRITESELLAYKNFGETSLLEIKAIMAAKNLELGQAVKDKSRDRAAGLLSEPAAEPEEDQGDPSVELMDKSVDELALSARSRKCLQKLNIETIDDLLQYSERQLLAVKNFGQTSLDEIKQQLAELGLSLRTDEG